MPPPPPPIVVVTGGLGYIGSHTAAELLRRTEYRVVCVDNLVNAEAATADAVARAGGQPVGFVEADVADARGLREGLASLGEVAAVLHFAALKSVPESVAEPVRYYENNVRGLVNVLAWMQERGCDRLVFSSSCSVYGDVGGGAVDERQALGEALSPYAHTKQLGEAMLGLRPGLRCAILRYFNPAGADASGLLGDLRAGGTPGLVPVLCRAAALGDPVAVFGDDYPTRDGTCVRDYVHVSDIAEAHVAALRYVLAAGAPVREVVNLGSGAGSTVREAIAAFESATGQRLAAAVAPRREGDIASVYSDNAKAARVLGWAPRRGLAEVMGSAWAWQTAGSSAG